MEDNKKYSEEELVLLLRQEDQHAFSYLYDNYAHALNGVIYHLVEDRELSEDILQDVFLKIWNNFASYDKTKGRLYTWMLNIARNTTIDMMRSKNYKKQRKISGDENSVSYVEDSSQGTDRFDAIGVNKQLSILKPEELSIINMAYFSGYTQDEISREMSIPLGTVKTKMRNAIISLRKVLVN